MTKNVIQSLRIIKSHSQTRITQSHIKDISSALLLLYHGEGMRIDTQLLTILILIDTQTYSKHPHVKDISSALTFCAIWEGKLIDTQSFNLGKFTQVQTSIIQPPLRTERNIIITTNKGQPSLKVMNIIQSLINIKVFMITLHHRVITDFLLRLFIILFSYIVTRKHVGGYTNCYNSTSFYGLSSVSQTAPRKWCSTVA